MQMAQAGQEVALYKERPEFLEVSLEGYFSYAIITLVASQHVESPFTS